MRLMGAATLHNGNLTTPIAPQWKKRAQITKMKTITLSLRTW
jgi:hypothetical protein